MDRVDAIELHYDRALAEGLPIATGVIEGACRYLVQDRMGRTGARWSLEGAEAVLQLRALRASGEPGPIRCRGYFQRVDSLSVAFSAISQAAS